jgi:hypothetical protein
VVWAGVFNGTLSDDTLKADPHAGVAGNFAEGFYRIVGFPNFFAQFVFGAG